MNVKDTSKNLRVVIFLYFGAQRFDLMELELPAKQKGHPKGLYLLFATEMWERFNYYGMRAILIYFMTQALLFENSFASNLYGSYLSLLYLTPLVGGYIADRFWGNKRSIIAGGLMMAAGEGLLFICASVYHSSPDLAGVLFFAGLGFMATGNGFFKPNISSLVGQLYPKGDRRIDPAYTIFYMGINLGAAIGPIICGLVGNTGDPADFKWAFLVGGVGMIISVIIQKLYHNKYVLSPEGKVLGLTPYTKEEIGNDLKLEKTSGPNKAWLNPVNMVLGMLVLGGILLAAMYLDSKYNYLSYLLGAAFLFIGASIFSDKSLTADERKRIWVLFIIAFFVVFFWAAYEQTGASLSLFANDKTNLNVWGDYHMPPSFFQSFNSIFIILFAPLFAWFWLRLGSKQPATPTKMGIGLVLLALGYLWIAYGVKMGESQEKVSMIWLTGMYLLHTWGELCLSPIGLSLFNKLAPHKFASLLMAVWFLGNAGGNKLAGVLSALYPGEGQSTSFLGYQINNLYDFFMIFVFMAGAAGIILLLLSKTLQKMAKGV